MCVCVSLVYDFVKGVLIGIYFSLFSCDFVKSVGLFTGICFSMFRLLYNLRMQRHWGLQMRSMQRWIWFHRKRIMRR